MVPDLAGWRRTRMPELPDVQHGRLIDPTARTLEVYEASSGRWHLISRHEDAAVVRARPFEAIELDLIALWAR
jgi:hypothetical protein